MGNRLAKVGLWLKRTALIGAVGAAVGGAYGATQRDEGRAESTTDYQVALERIRAANPRQRRPEPKRVEAPLPLSQGAAALLAEVERRKESAQALELAQRDWEDEHRKREENAKDAARREVLDAGCRQCGSNAAFDAVCGLLLAGALPGLIAAWFLLLYALSEIARAVRGSSTS